MRLSRRAFLGAAALAAAGCGGTPWGAKDDGPFAARTHDPLTRHALNRLTFGPRPGDAERVASMGVDAFIETQLAPESIDDRACQRRVRRLETLALGPGGLYEFKRRVLLDELTRGATLYAVYSERQLFEAMVEFWSDHFNVAASKGDCPWLITAHWREAIRGHALGRFRDLLRAAALSPAMLWYLDGRVNRKAGPDDRPNENYARELLELHTLGVHGGYTQQDVMEAARCLTGWTVRPRNGFFKGRVDFRAALHDDGPKTILGAAIPAGRGPNDAEDLIELAAAHPATARHIAAKLCRRFIGGEPAPGIVAAVAETFRRSDGSIAEALRTLFRHEAFRHGAAPMIKRPFHFAVSALRAADAETDGGEAIQVYLDRMGQSLFQYPTPDGYPLDGAAWTGTLLWRWHFAAALGENRLAGTSVPWTQLAARAGGEEAVMTHILGRPATEAERRACGESGLGAAFLFAAPAFQAC